MYLDDSPPADAIFIGCNVSAFQGFRVYMRRLADGGWQACPDKIGGISSEIETATHSWATGTWFEGSRTPNGTVTYMYGSTEFSRWWHGDTGYEVNSFAVFVLISSVQFCHDKTEQRARRTQELKHEGFLDFVLLWLLNYRTDSEQCLHCKLSGWFHVLTRIKQMLSFDNRQAFMGRGQLEMQKSFS